MLLAVDSPYELEADAPAVRAAPRPAPARAAAAAVALSLPALSERARACIDPGAHSAKLSRLALRLSEMGWLAPCPREKLLPEVRLAVGRWLDAMFGNLAQLRLCGQLHLSASDACEEHDDLAARPGLQAALQRAMGFDARDDHVAVALVPDSGGYSVVDIQPGVDRLEAIHSGLGRRALEAVCHAGADFEISGPLTALRWASYCWWGGYESEAEWMSEAPQEGDDPGYEGMTRAELEEALGLTGRGPLLSRAALRCIEAGSSVYAARAARLILALAKPHKDGLDDSSLHAELETESFNVEQLAVVGVGQRGLDATLRLGDDMAELFYGGDGRPREFVKLLGLPLGAGEFRRAERKVKAFAQRVRQLDALLDLLALGADR
jgi:hypothetical protein